MCLCLPEEHNYVRQRAETPCGWEGNHRFGCREYWQSPSGVRLCTLLAGLQARPTCSIDVQLTLDRPDETLSLVGSGRVVSKFNYTDRAGPDPTKKSPRTCLRPGSPTWISDRVWSGPPSRIWTILYLWTTDYLYLYSPFIPRSMF